MSLVTIVWGREQSQLPKRRGVYRNMCEVMDSARYNYVAINLPSLLTFILQRFVVHYRHS